MLFETLSEKDVNKKICRTKKKRRKKIKIIDEATRLMIKMYRFVNKATTDVYYYIFSAFFHLRLG